MIESSSAKVRQSLENIQAECSELKSRYAQLPEQCSKNIDGLRGEHQAYLKQIMIAASGKEHRKRIIM